MGRRLGVAMVSVAMALVSAQPLLAQIAKPPEEPPGTPPHNSPRQEPPKKEEPFKPAPVPPQPDAKLVVCTPFKDVRFTRDTPDLGEKSPESAVLREDPTTHAVDLLARLPAGFSLPAHWHSANVTHTIIKGTFEMSAEGPLKRAVEMGPGSFNFTPAGVIHEGRVKGSEPVLMFVTFDRARDTKLLDSDGPPPRGVGEGMTGPRPEFVCVKAADVQWRPFGQGVPAEFALLHQDPDSHAARVMLRVKGAMYVPRHWRPCGESLAVLSGSYTVPRGGGGSKARLDTGSFGYVPPKMVRNGWVGDGGVTLVISADGEWKTNWVENPTTPEDPQEKKE